jgi:hypothetical protein
VKAYRGVLKARISKLYGGEVTVAKARKLKARKDATPRDKQLANWFINMQTNRPLKKRKDPVVGTGKKPKGSGRRLYTDEDPTDTVPIKFATVADARKTIAKVMKINKPYARKVQILTVLEQRAKVMGKMEQARLAKSAKSTLKSKNEKSSPAKLLKGKKKKQKANTVTIPDNAITASSKDQMGAKKKFQRANNGVIPKGTKVTFNKTTGQYTYYYVPSDSPVKKATRKVCLPKAKIASMSQAERQKVIRAKRTAAAQGKKVRSSKSFIRDGSTRSKGLRDWVKQDWRQVGNPSKKCGEK